MRALYVAEAATAELTVQRFAQPPASAVSKVLHHPHISTRGRNPDRQVAAVWGWFSVNPITTTILPQDVGVALKVQVRQYCFSLYLICNIQSPAIRCPNELLHLMKASPE